jgi:uncharacterized protein YkwD
MIFTAEGYSAGFSQLVSGWIVWGISFWLALTYRHPVGLFIISKFHLDPQFTDIIGLIGTAIISLVILSVIIIFLLRFLMKTILPRYLNSILGAFVGGTNAIVSIVFVLLLLTILPVGTHIRNSISHSQISGLLINFAKRYGGPITSTLDTATEEAAKFLTVSPDSKERIALNIRPTNWDLVDDEESENRLLYLLNQERIRNGILPLKLDEQLRTVARIYSRKMFEEKYFSHFDPENHDISYRLNQAQILYHVAGENLAYAPDVDTAYNGLLGSEGHRRNMLDPKFAKVGIGAVDAGIFGKMFTQIFTN